MSWSLFDEKTKSTISLGPTLSSGSFGSITPEMFANDQLLTGSNIRPSDTVGLGTYLDTWRSQGGEPRLVELSPPSGQSFHISIRPYEPAGQTERSFQYNGQPVALLVSLRHSICRFGVDVFKRLLEILPDPDELADDDAVKARFDQDFGWGSGAVNATKKDLTRMRETVLSAQAALTKAAKKSSENPDSAHLSFRKEDAPTIVTTLRDLCSACLVPPGESITSVSTKLDAIEADLLKIPEKRTPGDTFEPVLQVLVAIEDSIRGLEGVYWSFLRRNIAVRYSPLDLAQLANVWSAGTAALRSQLSALTRNTDVLGAAVEERVRARIRESVFPLQVSHGTIAGLPSDPQVDGIVWEAQLAAPLVSEGSVAIVLPGAIRGIVEVKKSVNDLVALRSRLLGLAVEIAIAMGDRPGARMSPPMLAVILEDDRDPREVQRLSRGMAVALFRKTGDSILPNPGEWLRLLDFLHERVCERRSI